MSRLTVTRPDPGDARSPDRGERAFASGGDGTAAADDRYLRSLAASLRDRRLGAAALLWLASLRPLSFVGSQLLHVAAPLLDVVWPGAEVSRLARLLERRESLDRLLDALERDTRGAAAP